MIRRKAESVAEEVKPKGFDDYELRLGDVMRGERATMGKSLLDVQRELRIKASYIAAIENCDPDAFDTPGFIAGYVRSYARYLNMDPDKAFAIFCAESGFSVAHGMSSQASVVKKASRDERLARGQGVDIFVQSKTPFVPSGEPVWSGIEPAAIGSSLVLLGLIAAIGYGGWSVLQEVQRVQVAPVEQAPVVLSELDPLANVVGDGEQVELASTAPSALSSPRADALDRLYRPQALDVPVLVARDAPIATLDPRTIGNFATPARGTGAADAIGAALAEAQVLGTDLLQPDPNRPQVVEPPAPRLEMVAVRDSWVRVRAADGSVIFEGIMKAGDSWEPPLTEEPPLLRAGESGAIYFAMDGTYYGPAGDAGSVTSNLPLAVDTLKERYEVADLTQDAGLTRYAEARAQSTSLAETEPGID